MKERTHWAARCWRFKLPFVATILLWVYFCELLLTQLTTGLLTSRASCKYISN